MDKDTNSTNAVGFIIGIFACFYIGLLVVIIVDEAVLGTYWFLHNFGDSGRKVFTIMYWPLIKIIKIFHP